MGIDLGSTRPTVERQLHQWPEELKRIATCLTDPDQDPDPHTAAEL